MGYNDYADNQGDGGCCGCLTFIIGVWVSIIILRWVGLI